MMANGRVVAGSSNHHQVEVRPWDPTSPNAEDEFQKVVELHRSNKATLGHLPFSAFREAGERAHLLLGFVDGAVRGYLLYSTPRHQTLKLVHICVSGDARGHGLARAMTATATDANPERAVMTAHCRSDYGIDGFWRSLDMTPVGQRPGRAAAGSTLTIWMRRIGQLDLLESALYDSSRALAVLDSNVVIDLYSSEALERPDRQESMGISADWLDDLVDFAVSPEVGVDLNNLQPPIERQRVQSGIGALVSLRRDSSMRDTAEELIARMPLELVQKDPSLRDDAKHLADAILAGADYFVTRDQNLLDATHGWAFAEHGIEVVRPVEVIQRFMPPVAISAFRSEQLESVGLRWVQVADVTRDLEEAFLDSATAEKGTAFRKQLQAALAHPAAARVEELVDDRGRRWALLGTEVADKRLSVSTVRVGRGRLGATIAFQLIRYIRTLALARGASTIAITEPTLGSTVREALEADGFVGTPLSVSLARTPEDSAVATVLDADEVAAYERRNWPQVIAGRDIPVWIIPIQPRFARELIGYNDTLLQVREKPALGLAREFVYFAAPKVKRWQLPARVLWYVTKDDHADERRSIRAVVAFSRVVDSAVMSVEDAVEQYRALGVLREREIRARSHKGEVLVLRFEDTHEFSRPVGRRTLNQLLRKHQITTSLITMRAAKPGFFDEILSLQRDESER